MARDPSRVIPFPVRKPEPKRPSPLLKKIQDALDELEICLLALGIASELKLKRDKEV